MCFEDFIAAIKKWGEAAEDINAIVLVGSYARGTNKTTSDIDLCILTNQKEGIVSNPSIFSQFGKPVKLDIEYYGVATSIRIWYENSFEVEYTIVDINWISLPLDSGTQQVLSNGYKIIVDKHGYFNDIRL